MTYLLTKLTITQKLMTLKIKYAKYHAEYITTQKFNKLT